MLSRKHNLFQWTRRIKPNTLSKMNSLTVIFWKFGLNYEQFVLLFRISKAYVFPEHLSATALKYKNSRVVRSDQPVARAKLEKVNLFIGVILCFTIYSN